MATIPLSWNDPMFGDNTDSSNVTLGNGASLSNVSITDTGPVASVYGAGGPFTMSDVRINSEEGVRIASGGNINISNSYIETTGVGGDHADGIQAYAPGAVGNVTITNTAIVSHNQSATAGFWSADGYSGTFTFNNVMFEGGPYGLRIAADTGNDYISLNNVYFVKGSFAYDAFLFQENGGNIHITEWNNVRYATIVNGQLVPGDTDPSPLPVEGGTAPSAPASTAPSGSPAPTPPGATGTADHNQTNAGPTDTTNAFGTIVHTVDGSEGYIYALYDGLLGRNPDLLGYEGWVSASAHGASPRDIAAALLASPEGVAKFGSLDNAAFVEQLYETALHRPADSSGLQGWLSQLNHGASRADVALGIALSPENVADMQHSLPTGVFAPDPDASNVALLYYGLLGRAPDANGLTGWTHDLKQGASLDSVVQAFMNSAEYQKSHAGMTSDAQFVDSIYVNALGRHAEPSALQAWVNALDHGTSQTTVAAGIVESPEAQQHHLSQIEKGWVHT